MLGTLQDTEKQSSHKREQRAQKVVEHLGVKLHKFNPSNRELWTVVGADGDFLVDYDLSAKRHSYCSCDDYHFRVLGGQIPECYHIIAIKLAREKGQYSIVVFSDEEYEGFLRGLLKDIFARIS